MESPQNELKRTLNNETFPQIFRDWIKSLPKDDMVREYMIAKTNMRRIIAHLSKRLGGNN